MNPHKVTEDFENAVAKYTGAPYCVATTSCTMAIFLSLQWLKSRGELPDVIECPKRTYVSVPMQIVHAGSKISFVDHEWYANYRLDPTPIIDSARYFSSDMYLDGTLTCTSHHWGKTLGLQQGGCILTDDWEAVKWLRKARFDGRTPGVKPKDDEFILGWHAYLSPEIAALGLMKLSLLPKHNMAIPSDDYPDLSKAEVFRPYTVGANHVESGHDKDSRNHPSPSRIVTPAG
jgi:dTDP-4-amino-4,6-dideoxygalactose transaminase